MVNKISRARQVKKWDYGGIWRDYDMSSDIHLPNKSVVRVHDLMRDTPDFMYDADVLFIDPPCSNTNLKTFYSKSELDCTFDFTDFYQRLFEVISDIHPNDLFIEVFKSNKDDFVEQCQAIYSYVTVYPSFYYNNRKKVCWIIHATKNKRHLPIANMDESKVIKWICQNLKFHCIGDLCMGRGLVGKEAYIAGKRFVGTELNHKRLACLVDFIVKRISDEQNSKI